MISSGVAGCRPSGGRRFNTRRMLSAMFSHDPPTGVYTGMIPWANSHGTNSGVLCPARLSNTNSIRKGGNSAGGVGLTARPAGHRRHAIRDARAVRGGSGKPARISDDSRFSQGWGAALGQVVTPSMRTRPSAGWNGVGTLAVPLRMYSCGCRAGSPSGRQFRPG